MNKNQPILSLCIPTYARCEILRRNLEQIQKQLDSINKDELELIVSNNCSPDKTEEVVQSFIKQGMPIRYNCNTKNLGSNGNFLKCMQLATGKYVYLLGDDDFLEDKAIARMLEVLRGKEYGLVYIDTHNGLDSSFQKYSDNEAFIKRVSYYYTFMSGCVFRRAAMEKVENPERYIGTYLLQMPFYLTSTMLSNNNVVINSSIIKQVGVDLINNGGYNFFEVFVRNYQTIMGEYIQDKKLFAWLKKDIWLFVWMFTRRLLIDKNVGNFKTDKGWSILFKYYGNEWYFWWTLFKYPFGTIKRKIKKML